MLRHDLFLFNMCRSKIMWQSSKIKNSINNEIHSLSPIEMQPPSVTVPYFVKEAKSIIELFSYGKPKG